MTVPLRDLLFVACVATGLVGCGLVWPGVAFADGPDAADPTVHRVEVPPGMKLRLTASFEADWENEVRVYREGEREPAVVFSNRAQLRRWAEENATSEKAVYLIYSCHRSGSRRSWTRNRKRVLSREETTTRVGFEDGGGEDFDDGLLEIELVPTL